MERFTAKLTGEIDGHTISREFTDASSAQAWLQGAGLSEFEDQPARGEVSSSDGCIVWAKSHLQTKEMADWDKRLPVRRVLARLGLLSRKLR